MRQIDNLLLKQCPPSEFSWPAYIWWHVTYWKASELCGWLLFYSLPLLLVCPHCAFTTNLFVQSILLQECLSTTQKKSCTTSYLASWTIQEKSCMANAHLLIHLLKYIRLWGATLDPFGIWVWKLHSWANMCSKLFSYFICYYGQRNSLKFLKFWILWMATTPKQGMQQVSNYTYILGKMIQRRASTDECELLNISHGLVQIYTRVFNGTLYHLA